MHEKNKDLTMKRSILSEFTTKTSLNVQDNNMKLLEKHILELLAYLRLRLAGRLASLLGGIFFLILRGRFISIILLFRPQSISQLLLVLNYLNDYN